MRVQHNIDNYSQFHGKKGAQWMISIHVRFIGNAKSTPYSIIIDNKVFLFIYLLQIVNCELKMDWTFNRRCQHCAIEFVYASRRYMNYVIEYPSLRIYVIIQRYRFDIFQPRNTVNQ